MLQGSLENFALDEVLGLLSSTAKTGQLEIKGDRGNGSLGFRQGRLIDGQASYEANGNGIGDVMFELLRYSDGNFTFTAMDMDPTEFDEDVSAVLSDAENRLLDWRSIEAVVPTLNHVVTPVSDLPAEEVTITRAEWSALTIIAAGCPALVVCERLNLGEVEGSRQIKNLAERQLVIISDPSRSRAVASVPPTPPSSMVSTTTYTPASQNYPTPTPTFSTAEPRAIETAAADKASRYSTVVAAAPPSPAEITEFGEEVNDASELFTEADGDGGLLMEYLKQDN